MCNRIVQQGQVIKPGEPVMVLLRGPGGEMEIPFTEAIFGGPARVESRGYWIKREGAEPVLVPAVTGFGEKDQATGQQNWEETPAGSALEALLLPTPPGKTYRLLKVLTQPATPDQFARLGNDRAPVVVQPSSTLSATEPLIAPPSAPRPSPENSPALQCWVKRKSYFQSPARDGRKVLPSLRDWIGWFAGETQR